MRLAISTYETVTGRVWRTVASYRSRSFVAYHADRATAIRDAILAHEGGAA